MPKVMMKVPGGHCRFMGEAEFKACLGQKGYDYARDRDERIAKANGWLPKPKPAAKKAAKKG